MIRLEARKNQRVKWLLALSACLTVLTAPASGRADRVFWPSDGEWDDYFGYAIALRNETAVVGAVHHNGHRGAAYVFTRPSVTAPWTEVQKLTASDGAAWANFGRAVAIEGSWLAVGAPEQSGGAGSVYLFEHTSTGWIERQILTAPPGAAMFGFSLAMSGTSLVIGAPGETTVIGRAFVFSRTTTWRLTAALAAPTPAAGNQLGYSVDVDDGTAVIGAPNSNVAHVFTSSGGGWSHARQLGDLTVMGRFGHSVAIDDDTLLIGAPYEPTSSTYTGAIHFYDRVGSGWGPARRIEAGAFFEEELGFRVALDGQMAAVGSVWDDFRARGAGGVQFYERAGRSWRESDRLSFGVHMWLGGLAVQDSTVLVGLPLESWSPDDSGAVQVWEQPTEHRPDGASCSGPLQCASHYCSDGVCCGTSCGSSDPGDCWACSVAAGGSRDGVCGVVSGRTCGADAGVPVDGGMADAGSPMDGGFTDAGPSSDGGFTDAGPSSDGGFTDAGPSSDGGFTDAGPPDGGTRVADAGMRRTDGGVGRADAGSLTADAGAMPPSSGCTVAHRGRRGQEAPVLIGLLVTAWCSRRKIRGK